MKDQLIDLVSGYKRIKLAYYLKTNLTRLIPSSYNNWYKNYLEKLFSNEEELAYILKRVNYYNRLTNHSFLQASAKKISEISMKNISKVYYFDSMEYLRYFNKKLKINTLFGDIIHIPNSPSIVKSRPISTSNENSILLKLNKVRHFIFINDKNTFSNKKDLLIGRSILGDRKQLRIQFLKTHFENPLCDIGQTNNFGNNKWLVSPMPIHKQLKYKFILCWEGNDVASNLKWVMSSNSIAVMTKPRYETWFMEGTLVSNFHYIEIKDDFSDLDEKLKYYSKHTEEAEKIIKNANEYTKQFLNKKREDLISLLVLEKYFQKTNQMQSNDYKSSNQ